MASQLNQLEGKPATGADWARAGHTVSIGGSDDSAFIGYPGLLVAAPEVAELLINPFLLSPCLLDLAWPVRAPTAVGQICSSLDECSYLSQVAQVVAGNKEGAPPAHGAALQRAVDGQRD